MTTPLSNRVPGTVTDTEGQLRELPATILDTDAATILRNYFHWAMTNQLEPELFCKSCYDGTRGSRATYQITDGEIVIVCSCQIRYFKGAWTAPAALEASRSVATEGAEAMPVRLSADAARLLRLYKKVLDVLGLIEALRCNACFHLQREDGCEAQVGNNSIRIRCRCSDRTYFGMSV